MRCFPQLATGGTAQFPISKRRIQRTAYNLLPDGSVIKLPDPGLNLIEWDLRFEDLSDDEALALEDLFLQSNGSLSWFTFIDPLHNLLSWSEDLEQAAWEKDPLLSLTRGGPDPANSGDIWALSNSTGATRGIQQTLGVPTQIGYCFSIWARSADSAPAWLTVGDERTQKSCSPEWRRIWHSRPGGSEADSLLCRLDIGANSSLEVYGLQLEAQPSPSAYKRTTSSGGVYHNARFGDDVLRITTTGPNRNRCRCTVITNANGL